MNSQNRAVGTYEWVSRLGINANYLSRNGDHFQNDNITDSISCFYLSKSTTNGEENIIRIPQTVKLESIIILNTNEKINDIPNLKITDNTVNGTIEDPFSPITPITVWDKDYKDVNILRSEYYKNKEKYIDMNNYISISDKHVRYQFNYTIQENQNTKKSYILSFRGNWTSDKIFVENFPYLT